MNFIVKMKIKIGKKINIHPNSRRRPVSLFYLKNADSIFRNEQFNITLGRGRMCMILIIRNVKTQKELEVTILYFENTKNY